MAQVDNSNKKKKKKPRIAAVVVKGRAETTFSPPAAVYDHYE